MSVVVCCRGHSGATIKYHRLVDSKRIPTAVEAEKSRMQVLADSVPGETPPGLQMEAFLLGPHVGKRSGILASFHEAINPIVSASAS